MNVYFEESYWGCLKERDKEEPGREIRLEAGFTWKGRMWQIPAVYVCRKGIVVDFCGRIDPEEIRVFYEKQENPFGCDFRIEAKINEGMVQTQMGCGTCWCPPSLRPEEEAVSSGSDQVEELLLKTYGLDTESGWVFWRNSFAWQESAPENLISLDFIFTEDPVLIQGPHFRTGQGQAGQKVEFVHPATNRTYVLEVLAQEAETLENSGMLPMPDIRTWPTHFQVLHYQVEPELPAGELTVSDCEQSDQPVHRERPAAASMAVIGGADGPTSFFVAGKQPDSGTQPKRRVAYSALHYEPEETVEWKLTFQVRQDTKKEVRVEL